MSRSYRHTPITGMSMADSEKRDKQRAHRLERRVVRLRLQRRCVDEPLPVRREVTEVYCFAKDGKQWFDPRRHPKLMRK